MLDIGSCFDSDYNGLSAITFGVGVKGYTNWVFHERRIPKNSLFFFSMLYIHWSHGPIDNTVTV